MLKVMGVCLTLDTSLQLFWVLTGTGSNGKGRLMNLLEECLGCYYQAVSPTFLTRRRESANEANEALMSLVKARLAVFQEPENGEVIQAGTVKAITGEDTLSSRANYGKQTKFRPKFKSFLVANDLPATSEATVALFRRIRIIHFPTSFVENPKAPDERKIDVNLDKKLKSAAPYFIGLLIEHYRLYLTEGLLEPVTVSQSTKRYQDDNDVVKAFIDDHLELVGTRAQPSKDCGVEWSVVRDFFKREKSGSATLIKKLKESLGTYENTSRSREQFTALVGYDAPDTGKAVGFRGFLGCRWKGAPPREAQRSRGGQAT